jgi:hypothetical protein
MKMLSKIRILILLLGTIFVACEKSDFFNNVASSVSQDDDIYQQICNFDFEQIGVGHNEQLRYLLSNPNIANSPEEAFVKANQNLGIEANVTDVAEFKRIFDKYCTNTDSFNTPLRKVATDKDLLTEKQASLVLQLDEIIINDIEDIGLLQSDILNLETGIKNRTDMDCFEKFPMLVMTSIAKHSANFWLVEYDQTKNVISSDDRGVGCTDCNACKKKKWTKILVYGADIVVGLIFAVAFIACLVSGVATGGALWAACFASAGQFMIPGAAAASWSALVLKCPCCFF